MKRAVILIPILCLAGALLWRSLRKASDPADGSDRSVSVATSPVPTSPTAVSPGKPAPPLRGRGGLRIAVYADGLPVKGARVEVLQENGPGKMDFLTLADGAQTLGEVPEGRFHVTVRHEHRVPQYSPVDVPANRLAELRFDLQLGGRLFGRVVDRAGAPVPKTRVNLLQPKTELPANAALVTETDDQGRYQLDGAPLEELILHCFHPRFQHWTGQSFRLRDASDVTEINAVLDRGTRLSGRVVDEGGRPVRNAMVLGLNERSYSAITDAEGRFELFGLGERPLSVSVNARGFGTKLVRGVVPETADLVIPLVKGGGISARLEATPELEAFTLFLCRYETEVGQEIRTPCRAEEAPEGRVLVRDIEPGSYRVEVDAPGYQALDKPEVRVIPGETQAVTIRLKKSP